MKKQIIFIFVIAASIFSGPLSAQTVPTDNRSSVMALGNIDRNFWGLDGSIFKIDPANNSSTGADPEHRNNAISSQVNSVSITYTVPVATLGAASSFSGVSCGTSRAGTKHTDVKPQSIQDTTKAIDTCLYLYERGLDADANKQWQSMYDTLKLFVEHCPTNQYAYKAFIGMSNACDYGGNGPSPGCWTDFRNWLLSAFAWNPGNAQYFCADFDALAGTFSSVDDTTWSERNTAGNKSESVLYWLLHNPSCNNPDDSETYANTRGSQIRTWLDTQDTSKVPLDTTIYSMHDLGLDSVLKYAGLLGVNNNTPSIISSASAYPNPAGTGTVISFGVAREAYVGINLYDVLGHQVSSAGFGAVVEPGNLSIPMSLVGLPPGTYFARIQTTYGEAQTVKLVKE